MPGEEVVEILAQLEAEGVVVWLDGGWAVDAALAEQTRSHDDLDLVVELRLVARLVSVLARRGYEVGRGESPKSLELVDPSGRQVDVHPVVLTAMATASTGWRTTRTGSIRQPGSPGKDASSAAEFAASRPRSRFSATAGTSRTCRHTTTSWALSRRYDLPVPAEYRRPRESYEPR